MLPAHPEDAECSICLSSYKPLVGLVGCDHCFCRLCITQWCTTHIALCPVCRSPVYRILNGTKTPTDSSLLITPHLDFQYGIQVMRSNPGWQPESVVLLGLTSAAKEQGLKPGLAVLIGGHSNMAEARKHIRESFEKKRMLKITPVKQLLPSILPRDMCRCCAMM